MELPKHTCISCAYLCQTADNYFAISPRRTILENKHPIDVQASCIYLVCFKGKLPSFYISGKTVDDIRNIVISLNTCKHWTPFINGVSAAVTEQKQSSKWAKLTFWGVIATLIITIITLIVTWATRTPQP